MKLFTLFNSIRIDKDLIEIEKSGLSRLFRLGSNVGWCVIPVTSLACIEFKNRWYGTMLLLTIQKVAYEREMEVMVMKKIIVKLPGMFSHKRNKLKREILCLNDKRDENQDYYKACMNVMKNKPLARHKAVERGVNWNITLS